MENNENYIPHKWSGWPGAWCLDCGIGDKDELCVAQGHDPNECNDPTHRNGSCKNQDLTHIILILE